MTNEKTKKFLEGMGFEFPPKTKKKKAITSDLFAVDTCHYCNGEGQIEVKDDITEDCDICNGSGIVI